VLLEKLPAKMFHQLLRSITWTEVDVAFPIKNPLRQLVSGIAHPRRWIVAVGKIDYIFRRRLLRIRARVARLRG
jgi:hypothetical protein